MLFSLCGRVHPITEKESKRVWIELEGGTGYEIVTNGCIRTDGEFACVFILSHTTEDGTRLYGFKSMEDRVMAEAITEVRGIGPAIASRTVQALGTAAFLRMVSVKDIAGLAAAVKGMGKTKAEEIIRTVKSPFASLPAAEAASPELEKVELVRKGLISLGIAAPDMAWIERLVHTSGVDASGVIALYLIREHSK